MFHRLKKADAPQAHTAPKDSSPKGCLWHWRRMPLAWDKPQKGKCKTQKHKCSVNWAKDEVLSF